MTPEEYPFSDESTRQIARMINSNPALLAKFLSRCAELKAQGLSRGEAIPILGKEIQDIMTPILRGENPEELN